MESFKVLICFAFLAICALAAAQEAPKEANIAPVATPEGGAIREKKQAILPYLGAYPYAYSGLPYAYSYSHYGYDDGKYYPGKYEKPYLYRSYPYYSGYYPGGYYY